MVNYDLNIQKEERSSKIEFELLSDIYRELSGMCIVPTSDLIFNHYNLVLEYRITKLQEELYPDDVYESGLSLDNKHELLPDCVRADLQSYIKLDSVTLEEIEDALNFYNIFFIKEHSGERKTLVNQIVLEVW
jgi:hypothetical protein